MSTTVVRFTTGGGPNGPIDSATAHAEEDLTASGSADTTTITASGVADEICIIYPLTLNVRVAFGESPTANATSGPVAFAGVPNAFRNVKAGDKVSIIQAT